MFLFLSVVGVEFRAVDERPENVGQGLLRITTGFLEVLHEWAQLVLGGLAAQGGEIESF
jgi:hypothetical protein